TFLSSAFKHGALPVLIIVVVFAGGWLLNMRNVMINTVEEDYVGMAHAKGLKDRRVMTMYAGRNAILPPLTGFASQFGAAAGGLGAAVDSRSAAEWPRRTRAARDPARARELEVEARLLRLRLDRRRRARGAADRAQQPERHRRAARPGAEPALPVRDDRPGLRRLLAGRVGRAPVARGRRARGAPLDRARG